LFPIVGAKHRVDTIKASKRRLRVYMVAAMKPEHSNNAAALRTDFKTQMEAFARREVHGRDELRDCKTMPPALWRAIGDAGLAAIAIPREYGGSGGDLRALAVAAEALSAQGGVKGVTTSWLSRQLIARLQILAHGTPAQRQTYLPALAAGDITPCLAISEPGAGAHPKHLTTSARRDGDDFVISGEKSYLTNGPIADIFLVLAITDRVEGRKQYSILIVPRDAPGMEFTDGVKIDFLRPAPHCGLRLHDVRIPAANLLGGSGDAFAQISLPMRTAEDALFAATIAGSMRHLLVRLAGELDASALDDENLRTLGQLSVAPDGLSALAFRAAGLLDRDAAGNAGQVGAISASARDWARTINQRISALMARNNFTPSGGLAAEYRDIDKTLGIARSAHAIMAQRRARALLAP
jgi:acyl-CoA dehydrogenase